MVPVVRMSRRWRAGSHRRLHNETKESAGGYRGCVIMYWVCGYMGCVGGVSGYTHTALQHKYNHATTHNTHNTCVDATAMQAQVGEVARTAVDGGGCQCRGNVGIAQGNALQA